MAVRRFWLMRTQGQGKFYIYSPSQWKKLEIEPEYESANEPSRCTAFRVTETTPFGTRRYVKRFRRGSYMMMLMTHVGPPAPRAAAAI